MKIEILGMGCPKCRILYDNVNAALKNTGKQAEVVKIENINKIMEHSITLPPALVVDGTVKSSGKVLTVKEIENLLK